MLMQDQARAIQQNKRVSETKAKAVQSNTTFRPQVQITNFKRNYQATYGDPQQAAKSKMAASSLRRGKPSR